MAKRRANGEGSIYKRKDGLWAAEYFDNTGKRRQLYGKSQQIVKDKLKEAIKQSDAGLSMDKSKITLSQWLTDWLEVYAKPMCREGTYDIYYRQIHQHIIPAFPKVLLKDLRPDMLQRFFNEKAASGRLDGQEGGLSIKYLNHMKVVLSGALKQAVENDIIPANITKKVKLPPIRKPNIPALTRDEQKRLEEVALNDYNLMSFAFVLDLYTGMRIGELLALKISDIDFERNELYVQRQRSRVGIPDSDEQKTKMVEREPKTAKGRRTIPLTGDIVKLLKKYLEDRAVYIKKMRYFWERNSAQPWTDEDYLFITERGGPAERSSIRNIFVRILEAAEVKPINLHALRHTFATRCLENGFDIRTLADILGHADVSETLNTYAHAMEDQKRANMEKLPMLSSNGERDK